jgi:hypothetical protein
MSSSIRIPVGEVDADMPDKAMLREVLDEALMLKQCEWITGPRWGLVIGQRQRAVFMRYALSRQLPEGYDDEEVDPDGLIHAVCGVPVRVVESPDYLAAVLLTRAPFAVLS